MNQTDLGTIALCLEVNELYVQVVHVVQCMVTVDRSRQTFCSWWWMLKLTTMKLMRLTNRPELLYDGVVKVLHSLLYGNIFLWLDVVFVTSTIVFYRTRVYQMQPRNGQNWHSSVGKYVHHKSWNCQNRILHISKINFYFGFSDTRDKVNAD